MHREAEIQLMPRPAEMIQTANCRSGKLLRQMTLIWLADIEPILYWDRVHRQESNFFYISGCGNVPGQQILAWSKPINGNSDDLDVTVHLFIPELDELDVM